MRFGIVVSTASDNVISNNAISNIYQEDAVLIYRSRENHIFNNSISAVSRGITLANHSIQNIVEGNVVSEASQMALSMHFSSDANLIRNNQADLSAIGIILRKSSDNYIYLNNFVENIRHASDDAHNTWSHEGRGNYWSGWASVQPYIISLTANDAFPQPAALSINTSITSEPKDADYREIPLEQVIEDELVFSNQSVVLDRTLTIKDGAKLIIENSDVKSAGNLCRPITIRVEPGGVLQIKNSTISADEDGLSPICIDPAEGASVTIINSRLHHIDAGLHGPGPTGPSLFVPSGATIENNLIEDADQGMALLQNASNASIKNNTFRSILRESIFFFMDDDLNNEIENNKIVDLAIYEIQPQRTSALPEGWESISGLVTYEDVPVCAMVLANGQHMFTCDENLGRYQLDVPLDQNGEITLYAFVSGQAPFKETLDISSLDTDIAVQSAGSDSKVPTVNTSIDTQSTDTGWARISGTISQEDIPLCAMALANGQHMFTCGESEGLFDLTVPLDGNGQITFFVFVEGLQSYQQTLTP